MTGPSFATPDSVVAALLLGGLAFLGWALASGGWSGPRGRAAVLDLLSLPVGVFAFATAIASALAGSAPAWALLLAGLVGAALIGRPLADLPITGIVSLGLAIAAGLIAWSYLGGAVSPWAVVALAGIVFVVSYLLLSVAGALFKLVGLLTKPRILAALVAAASFLGGILELVRVGGAALP